MGAVACTVLLAGPTLADQGQAHLRVATTVPARVSLQALEAPVWLTLTPEDVARGYKDVATRHRLRHNDRAGILLSVSPRVGLAREIRVSGLGTEFVLGADTLEVHLPGDPFEQDIALGFRFLLDATARPGTVELPVHLAASPL
jgi:hypothetical protein